MFIRRLSDCPLISAGDGTRLRELLHPNRKYHFSGRYSLAHAILKPDEVSAGHILATLEVYFILSGHGMMRINDESSPVSAGDSVVIPSGSVQSIANIGKGDLEFLCIVDPAWCKKDETILGPD